MGPRLAAACVLLAITVAAAAQDQDEDASKVEITATHVAGNVFLLQAGDASNIAASVAEDGIVLVDDAIAPLAGKIRAALKGLSIADKPVRFIIITHYHFDHTGGNLPFADSGSVIISHDNARARLRSGGLSGNGGSVRFDNKPADIGALPIITFDHDLSIHLNGQDIRAVHYPAGHTDGDVVVYFSDANVVHMGDEFVRYGFPFIDVDAGGTVQGMIKACESVIATVPPNVKVIPGHGDVASLADVREYVAMLKGTTAAVEKALHSGKTLDQMKRANVLGAWSGRYSGFISTDGFLETIYNSLTHRELASSVKHN